MLLRNIQVPQKPGEDHENCDCSALCLLAPAEIIHSEDDVEHTEEKSDGEW